MVRQSLYIDKDLNNELRIIARAHGLTINDVIRRRLRQQKSDAPLREIEKKIDAVFTLLNFIVGDLGFVVGATRAGCKTSEKHAREGEFYETNFKTLGNSLKANIDTNQTNEKDG
jgi:hypothetical protein